MNSASNRRSFLAASTLATAAGLSGPASGALQAAATPARVSRIQLAISTYSYWHFKTAKVPVETVIEKAAALGVPAVDVLHRQMDIPEKDPLTEDHRAYLRRLKRHAFRHGVNLVCLSIHQDFVDPSADFRRQQVAHTIKCIEIASELGVPCIRLNSGRWNTIASFDDLMKARELNPSFRVTARTTGSNGAWIASSNALRPRRVTASSWPWKITGDSRALRKDCSRRWAWFSLRGSGV